MNRVGLASIILGVLIVCGRAPFLFVPHAALHRVRWLVDTNGRLRALGAFIVGLAAALVWAGGVEDTGLATVLTVLGWAMGAASVPLLLLFPGAYRSMVNTMLPGDASESMFLWRFAGLFGSTIGVLLIYFGVLASS